MSEWGRFNDQFRETDWERKERWRRTKRERTAAGECWQCAKLLSECSCPNLRKLS